MRKQVLKLVSFLCVVLLTAMLVPQRATADEDDPPSRVARLAYAHGNVSFNPAGTDDWVSAVVNRPITTGGGYAYTIHAREEGFFNGIDQLDADIQRVRDEGDDFDYWCAERDRRIDHSASARYVSDDVIGYEDLDEYGGWRPVPEYGTVWFPHTTVVGWAPYRYGHWVWISPWGWTWVDDEPWGFAPFHYGRWVVVGGVWGWVPCAPRTVVGVAYVRPVYAPALVAWVGGPP